MLLQMFKGVENRDPMFEFMEQYQGQQGKQKWGPDRPDICLNCGGLRRYSGTMI
jgi:hypothetical protein